MRRREEETREEGDTIVDGETDTRDPNDETGGEKMMRECKVSKKVQSRIATWLLGC